MAKLVLNNIEAGFASNTALNANFDLIETAIENTLSRDGTSPNDMFANLDMNGYLIINQGNPIAISGFTWEGPWVTGQGYSIGDIVENNGTAYIAVVAHTSDVLFADDLTAGYWQVLATASLPSQVGAATKFLQSDGATASWQAPDATEVSFTQTGTGAAATTVNTKLLERVTPEDFGALGNGVTDDVAAIQAAIDSLITTGGIVYFGPKTYMVGSTITLPSKVFLQGSGSGATRIKLVNSSNVSVIATTGFSTLTGQNKWLLSESVPYGFGIDAMTIDGNRANQTAGSGVVIYGKGYTIGYDLKIVECKEYGFYSECAWKGGQVVEQDMPEGEVGFVKIYKTGKEGIIWRGPHDMPIHNLSVSQAGQDGIYDGVSFEAQTNIYQGATYITGSVHAYACTGRGISVKCYMPGVNMLTGENCDRDGVVFEAAGETAGMVGSTFSNVNFCEAYGNDNNDTGTYWGVRVSGSNITISSCRISSAGQAAGCLYISGSLNTMGSAKVIGVNAVADGTGVKVDGSYHDVTCTISNFDSGAAVGLNTAGTSHCLISATMFGCSVTGWLNSGASTYDIFRVTGFAGAGTPFTQTGSFTQTNVYDVVLNYTGTQRFSDYGGSTSAILLGNTSQTITHLGFITPDASDISITQIGDWGTNRMWVANITATTFDVVTDVAAAGALPFGWKLDL